MRKNRGFYNGRIGNIMKVICLYFFVQWQKIGKY